MYAEYTQLQLTFLALQPWVNIILNLKYFRFSRLLIYFLLSVSLHGLVIFTIVYKVPYYSLLQSFPIHPLVLFSIYPLVIFFNVSTSLFYNLSTSPFFNLSTSPFFNLSTSPFINLSTIPFLNLSSSPFFQFIH